MDQHDEHLTMHPPHTTKHSGQSSAAADVGHLSYDRFIPSRAALNSPARGRLSAPSSAASATGYDRMLRDQLGMSPAGPLQRNSSVLHFNGTPAKASHQTGENAVEGELSRIQVPLLQHRNEVQCGFPRKPYLALDAPGLRDDYYASLLDWSKQNVICVALDDAIWLRRISDGQVTCLQRTLGTLPAAVKWSHRGTYLTVSTISADMQVWDADAQTLLRSLSGHRRRVAALAWGGVLMASGSRDCSVLLHDVRDSAQPQRLRWHKGEVCGLQWSPDGNQLASGGHDNSVAVWDWRATSQPVATLQHTAAAKALAWSPHRRGLLATGAGKADRHIRLWNTVSGKCCVAFDTGSQVCNLAFSPTEEAVASSHGFSQNEVAVWATRSLNKLGLIKAHAARVCCMALSPDGQTLLTGAGDDTLRFWSIFPKARSSALAAPSSGLKRTHIR